MLSGGGARGAYQVGVLRWIAREFPDLHFPVLTGVSAGSINTVFLAGRAGDLGAAVDSLAEHWLGLTTGRILRADAPSLLSNAVRVLLNVASGGSRFAPTVKGLVDTEPLRQFLGTVFDPEGVRRNVESGRLRAVAVSATSYATGQSLTFVQAAPGTQMWERVRRRAVPARLHVEHVMASTAIPLFFPARAIDGEWFGDGGLRQSHPLSPAVHLGADRILAISSRHHATGREAGQTVSHGYPPAARIVGVLLNSIFLDNLDVDAERLTRINHLVSRVPESRRWLVAEREIRLLVLRPSRDIGRIAARHEASLPRALRYLVRGLGSRRMDSADLVSYLLFEKPYLRELVELGEHDAERSSARIRRFMTDVVRRGSGA